MTDRKQMEDALGASEEKFSKAFRSSPDSITISTLADGRYVEVNDSFHHITGYCREEVIGRTSLELNIWANPEDRTRFKQMLQQQGTVRNLEFGFRIKSGEVRVGLVSAEIIDFGSELCILAVIRDITDHKQVEEVLLRAKVAEAAKQALEKEITQRQRAEEALRLSEEKFSKAFRSSPDSITISALKDGCIVEVNDGFLRLTGYHREEVIGHTSIEQNIWANPEDRTRMQQILQQQGAIHNLESNFRTKSGKVRVGLLSAEIIDFGGELCLLAVIRDITDRKRAEEQLLRNAFYDALTSLPNRALFINRLGHEIELAKQREDYLFAVLVLDLDRFKLVNDSLGHIAGDQLLIAIARRLELCLRCGDTVARFGGDEFTILLRNIKDISDATHVADRIHAELALPFNVNGYEVFSTASVGIALSATGYDQPEDLLRDADTAMYHAKALGKARYEVFDTAMHANTKALLQLETDLRRAVERQELRIYYQPIVSLQSNRISGFEALVRWQHPQRGLVFPEEFIAVAEETGLIIPIGRWVLHEACRQMHKWHARFSKTLPLKISVNLSSKQFAQPDLVEQIEETLKETGLDAQSLKLEITETVIMENAESTTAMLLQLKALGVQLQIDDFGTGYSSLSYLHRFPVDSLKIDRSFVSRIGFDTENSEIVQTIVMLAHNLSMDVVAEGVETADQLAQLRALKCKYGQGYFFSKPLDTKAVEALIADELWW
jgi:diguanylate cyclase (GGDEF)-like protein/PAS domain S-box-containing protein